MGEKLAAIARTMRDGTVTLGLGVTALTSGVKQNIRNDLQRNLQSPNGIHQFDPNAGRGHLDGRSSTSTRKNGERNNHIQNIQYQWPERHSRQHPNKNHQVAGSLSQTVVYANNGRENGHAASQGQERKSHELNELVYVNGPLDANSHRGEKEKNQLLQERQRQFVGWLNDKVLSWGGQDVGIDTILEYTNGSLDRETVEGLAEQFLWTIGEEIGKLNSQERKDLSQSDRAALQKLGFEELITGLPDHQLDNIRRAVANFYTTFGETAKEQVEISAESIENWIKDQTLPQVDGSLWVGTSVLFVIGILAYGKRHKLPLRKTLTTAVLSSLVLTSAGCVTAPESSIAQEPTVVVATEPAPTENAPIVEPTPEPTPTPTPTPTPKPEATATSLPVIEPKSHTAPVNPPVYKEEVNYGQLTLGEANYEAGTEAERINRINLTVSWAIDTGKMTPEEARELYANYEQLEQWVNQFAQANGLRVAQYWNSQRTQVASVLMGDQGQIVYWIGDGGLNARPDVLNFPDPGLEKHNFNPIVIHPDNRVDFRWDAAGENIYMFLVDKASGVDIGWLNTTVTKTDENGNSIYGEFEYRQAHAIRGGQLMEFDPENVIWMLDTKIPPDFDTTLLQGAEVTSVAGSQAVVTSDGTLLLFYDSDGDVWLNVEDGKYVLNRGFPLELVTNSETGQTRWSPIELPQYVVQQLHDDEGNYLGIDEIMVNDEGTLTITNHELNKTWTRTYNETVAAWEEVPPEVSNIYPESELLNLGFAPDFRETQEVIIGSESARIVRVGTLEIITSADLYNAEFEFAGGGEAKEVGEFLVPNPERYDNLSKIGAWIHAQNLGMGLDEFLIEAERVRQEGGTLTYEFTDYFGESLFTVNALLPVRMYAYPVVVEYIPGQGYTPGGDEAPYDLDWYMLSIGYYEAEEGEQGELVLKFSADTYRATKSTSASGFIFSMMRMATEEDIRYPFVEFKRSPSGWVEEALKVYPVEEDLLIYDDQPQTSG